MKRTQTLVNIGVLAAAVLLFARTVYLYRPGILLDDAFISFRYAVNLGQGGGLVFNPGEPVEGYTNFLWTVLLAGAHFLGLDLQMTSLLISALAAFGTLILISRLGTRLFVHHSMPALSVALPLLLFAVMGSQARYILSGMETLLFTFLVTLGVYLAYTKGCSVWNGVVFGLAALTRPEGMLYFGLTWGILAFFSMNRKDSTQGTEAGLSCKPHSLILPAAVFSIIVGLHVLWRYSYYGYLLPNTYYAKASGFQWERLARGLEYTFELTRSWGVYPFILLAFLGLFSKKLDRFWILAAVFLVATLAYFIYVGGDFIVWFGPRFFLPVLPLWLLLSTQGLHQLVRWMNAPKVPSRVIFLTAGILLIFYAGWSTWPKYLDRLEGLGTQMLGWEAMGKWIQENTPADSRIATDAAGLIPFYSQRYSIDMFGLTDTHIAHLEVDGVGIVAHEKFDPAYVLSLKPDCIVSTWMSAEGEAISAGLPNVIDDFKRQYQLTAIAKVRGERPEEEAWVIPTQEYSKADYDAGYLTGLFCKMGLPQQ